MFYASVLPRAAAVLLISSPILIVVSTSARAHDAPTGWSYPFSCCSGYDCRPVEAKAISERPGGYVIENTGEVVTYADTRVKDSPDGEFHWCSVAGKADGKTICLFVPSRGY